MAPRHHHNGGGALVGPAAANLIAIGRADLQLDNIPDELKVQRSWVIWRAEARETAKGTKVSKAPLSASTGGPCKWSEPKSLATFADAVRGLDKHQADGIGFVFKAGHPVVGVDIDDCTDADGTTHPAVAELVRALPGYWEISPSGRGLKGFIRAEGVERRGTRLPDFPAPGIGIEIYTDLRHFTVTGHRHELSTAEATLPEAGKEFAALIERIEQANAERNPAPTRTQGRNSPAVVDLSDRELLDVARRAKNGPAFAALYDLGDWQGQGFPSQSEADLSLCTKLSFYLGADPGRVDAAFRGSALMRDKWDRSVGRGESHGQRTVSKAVAGTSETYSPPRRGADHGGELLELGRAAYVEDSRPQARVSADLEKTRKSLDAALCELGEPPLFRKGSALMCFQGDSLYQPDSRGLGMELAKLISFVKVKLVKTEEGKEETLVACYPPAPLTAGMIGAPHLFEAVRPLRRLVTAPRILADGSITEAPGYYPDARLFYVPKVRLGNLNLSLQGIKQTLEEPFLDFPFEGPSDLANTLAVPLSIVCGELYRGLSPIAVPIAPKYGSGKTKVIKVGVRLATGNDPTTIDYEPGEAFTKEITSTLLQGPESILIDNVAATLDSPRLAAIMTSETTHARLLGGNQMATLENTCFWAATGNNIELTGEMIRRAFVIRLNPDMENPEERRGFRIADLDEWSKDVRNQSRYVTACLALAKHWLAAGAPRFTERVSGSFKDWAEVIGGMLGLIGHSAFLDNRDDFRATADPEQEMWRDFVGEWWRSFGSQEVTTKDLLAVINLKDAHADETDYRNYRDQPLMQLGNGLNPAKLTRLGMLLKKRIGQVFGLPPGYGPAREVKVSAVGGNLARSRYFLRPITPDGPPVAPESKTVTTEPTEEEIRGALWF